MTLLRVGVRVRVRVRIRKYIVIILCVALYITHRQVSNAVPNHYQTVTACDRVVTLA